MQIISSQRHALWLPHRCSRVRDASSCLAQRQKLLLCLLQIVVAARLAQTIAAPISDWMVACFVAPCQPLGPRGHSITVCRLLSYICSGLSNQLHWDKGEPHLPSARPAGGDGCREFICGGRISIRKPRLSLLSFHGHICRCPHS